MRDSLSNTPNCYVRAGEFRGYLLTANAWHKYAKRNWIGAGNPANWLVNCTRTRQTSFCDFDEAITGAIYFTFHNGKKSSFDRPNYTLIQGIFFMAASFVVTFIRRLFSGIQDSIQTLCRLSIFHNYNSVFATHLFGIDISVTLFLGVIYGLFPFCISLYHSSKVHLSSALWNWWSHERLRWCWSPVRWVVSAL